MLQKSVSPQVTLASLDALSPCMIELVVAGISAVLKPSTPTSAAAKFTGFPASTTNWTHIAATYRR